jgi:hypothetical protein
MTVERHLSCLLLGMKTIGSLRATLVCVFSLAGMLVAPRPAFAQVGGEAHAAFVYGSQSDLRLTGIVGGGGLVIRDRFGVEGELGLTRDNSAERDLAPVLGISGNVRFTPPEKVVPFAAAGFTRLGDWGGWHAGGGVNIPASRALAIRIEFRGIRPVADFSGCVENARTVCSLPGNAWFLRAGMVFRFAR